MKTNKIKITQKDGIISIARNGEIESTYDCNRYIKLIKEDKVDAIWLANNMAEIMYGCLNCKSADAGLKDLNNKDQYSDSTYFECIDHFTD